jgi:hypothetical protein
MDMKAKRLIVLGVMVIIMWAYMNRVYMPQKRMEEKERVRQAAHDMYYRELCDSVANIDDQNLDESQRRQLKRECYMKFNAKVQDIK